MLGRLLLPLTAPGLWAGGTLIFLTCMKELPITLILSPLEFTSLATQVWRWTEEGFFARAAWPALTLLLLAAVPMMVMTTWENLRAARRDR